MRTLLGKKNFKIPEGYNVINPGKTSVVYGIPWIASEAVVYLNEYLTGLETCLDIGVGGSTLFYALRSYKVLGLEVDLSKTWELAIRTAIDDQGLSNIRLKFLEDEDTLIKAVEDLGDKSFDLVSIDTHHPINRKRILDSVLPKLGLRSILVLDNYADSAAWHSLTRLSHEEFLIYTDMSETHQVMDFKQPGWVGFGTRLVIPLST